MYTNVDFIPGGDNPVKGGFGYPLKEGYLTPFPLSLRRGEWRSRTTMVTDLQVFDFEIIE